MNKNTIIAFVAVGLSSASARAANYISDFSGLGVGDSLAGFDGWQQNEPNYNDGEDYPWAFGTEIGTGENARPAAAVGGWYNTDPPDGGGSFYAYRTIAFNSGIVFNMNFAIMDSEGFEWGGDLYGTERNSFRIGLNDGSAEIFSLVFEPNDLEDSDPLVNQNDTWNVSVSSGGIKSTASMAIYEAQIYGLSISLIPNAGNLDYSFSLTSSNTLSSSGTLAGLANTEINQLQIGIDPLDGQFGDNRLVFDGIVTAVPEPSVLVLVGAAAGGLAFRRRRHL